MRSNNKVLTATMREMLDYTLILTNERGDELWRYFDAADGRPRWKVYAIEPTDRTQIRNWQDVEKGADYFKTKTYFASDYILPKKYLLRVARLLGLDLKNVKKQITKKEIERLRKIGYKSKTTPVHLEQERSTN